MQSDLTLYYFVDAFSYVTLAFMVSSYLEKNPGLIYEQCKAVKRRGGDDDSRYSVTKVY